MQHACYYEYGGEVKYTKRYKLGQLLSGLTRHFLLMTATPHNGYRESFGALLELLDNQRFSRGTEPDRKQLEAVMVRRLKSDPSFAFNHLGMRRFPPRVLEPIEVPYTDEERQIHAALRQYTKLRTSRAEDNAERFATEFVLKTLKKRLFSCPAALPIARKIRAATTTPTATSTLVTARPATSTWAQVRI